MKTKFTVRKPSLTVRENILNLLRKSSKPLDAKTIAKKGKLNYNTVRKELGILRKKLAMIGFMRAQRGVSHTTYSLS